MTDRDHPPVTIRWLNRRLIIVVVAVSLTGALLISALTVAVITSSTNAAFREAAINGCDGSNLLRGFARLATHGGRPTVPDNADLADWLLRIRDCGASYDRGHVVTINAGEERAYLAQLAERKRVAVRGDHFVAIP